jgi:acyl transferase domain-containing protein/NAD(P)H-dependent flavin oxidoreductase YrpB (nitropropane dioxygenase family)/NAD(P)-dependent dehydrogenase (short-subunit alcohol dehydrogenase family)
MAFFSQSENLSANFEIAVLPSPGVASTVPFQHGVARAGALALLDVKRPEEIEAALDGLRELQCAFPATPPGVRLEYSVAAAWQKARLKAPDELILDLVIVAGGSQAREKSLLLKLKTTAARIFREVVSADEALSALDAGYDGLVVKGSEAGGRVGGESTFVLLQRIVKEFGEREIPIWVQGGVGPDAAAACRVAGACGVVLDVQLALAQENDCPREQRVLLEAMDGTETVCLGEALGAGFRVHRRVAASRVKALQQLESSGATREEFEPALRAALDEASDEVLWPVGQDAALAAPLVARYGSVARIVRAYRKASLANLRIAAQQDALGENGPLAQAHKTTTAIVQGPMTRVSDVAPFAGAVAAGGGLPFLALAMLREKAVETLLQETSTLLAGQPWGVGILGFVPAALRAEQLEVVLRFKPPYALLAGGRADQARQLEAVGIATYLHAPTPRLLRMFLDKGVRRFVFEGRECGGHVGPLSSFLLWQQAVNVVREFQDETGARQAVDILFAGGVHDALSAAMATAVAAPLLEKNVRFGVLMGTAYLFTREAVEAGAIAPSFQDEARACRQTALLDASGGHAIRCAPTPYVEEYSALKQRLLKAGAAPDELRRELEELNVGRLRLASKGVERKAAAAAPVAASQEEQKRRGMYMLGSVAVLRDEVLSIGELHNEVALGSGQLLREHARTLHAATPEPPSTPVSSTPVPIAVIGMACLYPDAPDCDALWRNILRNHDAIREVPSERWDAATFYEAGTRSPDRIVSKWGGFLDEVAFDPMRYGIVPNALSSIEPNQLLTLETMRRALESAGYDESTRALPRERTGVVLGAGGGISDLALAYATRCMAEKYFQESDLDAATQQAAIAALRRATPAQDEDSFPGTLPNVIAGRVANRFGLGGLNCVVDAACASSLAALETALKELRAGDSDVMLVGGVDTQQTAIGFLSFSTTKALSPRGRCRPFDAGADGIAISEGIGAVVLKRLDDAERDGDRIFAVVRDVAAASDGREKSLTAPASQGQRRAISRAYEKLEFSPAEVALVEAHGTGTVVGDRTELQSLRAEWEAAGATPQSSALGSIKSQIGHTKNAAGLAGLIKTALALHHRVLPPTLAEKPGEALRDRAQPLYLNTRPRPWLSTSPNAPRRAAVSAFGFGGTNFHAVLEEYSAHAAPTPIRPAELFVFRAASRDELKRELHDLSSALSVTRADWRLVDLAASLAQRASRARGEQRLAIVARDSGELRTRIEAALKTLEQSTPPVPGMALGEGEFTGKIAFLFPGQGSQSPDMLGELALCFPVVRETFERADHVLSGVLPQRLSDVIFPPPAYSPEEEAEQRRHLNETWLAQPALGAADYAISALLYELGVNPDLLAGHSYGEYVALCAAGVFDFDALLQLSEARGRIAHETQGGGEIGMIAVRAGEAELRPLLAQAPGVNIAAFNAPQQSVIGGRQDALAEFCRKLDENKIRHQKLALSAGFHIPEAAAAAEQFRSVLESTPFAAPRLPVYANLTAAAHESEAGAMREVLVEHLVRPLEFCRQLEAMRENGARLFLEVGPKAVLTGLATQTFQASPDAPQLIATNRGAAAMNDFLEAVAQLYAAGVPVKLEKLFAGIETRPLAVEELKASPLAPTTWLVNGGAARPLNAPPKNARAANEAKIKPTQSAEPLEMKSPVLPSPVKTMSNSSSVSTPNLPPAPLPAGAVSSASGDAALATFQESMRQFLAYQAESQRQRQELMTRFLETQQAVLQSYLGGAPLVSPSTPAIAPIVAPPPLVPPVAPTIPYLETPIAPTPSLAMNGHTPSATMPPAPEVPSVQDVTSTPAVSASAPVPTPVPEVDLRAVVLGLVSERTGYPIEMLDLDHNMEADLGIDSIKRTEIFGGLREQLNLGGDGEEQEEYFIQIAALRTLREVLEWLEESTGENQGGEAPAAPLTPAPSIPLPAEASYSNGNNGSAKLSAPELPAVVAARNLKRCVIRPALESLSEDVRTPRQDEIVLVTEDNGGRAREVVTGLRLSGTHVAVVRHAAQTRIVGPGVYEADLTSREAVIQLAKWVHEHEGAITTLSHLLPLDPPPGNSDSALEVRSLFHLASVFGEELKANGGALFSVTGQGGGCGLAAHAASTPDTFRPGAAALSGFLKALALEWPEVFIKAIDVDSGESEEYLLPQLVAEVSSTDHTVEAGHSSRGRVVVRAEETVLDTLRTSDITLDERSVIVVTGGARGITGAVCVEMARRFGSRFVLIGRAPLPHAEAVLSTEELRARELRRARENGEMLTPAQVEARVQSALRAQEMCETLAQIEEYSAGCEYHALDVRDGERLSILLREVRSRYGRIDGVIHGAGVIEDALLLAKQPDSFDLVFDTKVLPAMTLAQVLGEALFQESLQFTLFFSSVSAHFGNPGQSDYAAANEALNKLAVTLDHRWSARVAAIGWGPWSEIGMASPHLRDKLAAAGFDYLAPRDGVRLCLDELIYGRKGDSAVLLYAAHESETGKPEMGLSSQHVTQFIAREAAPLTSPQTLAS